MSATFPTGRCRDCVVLSQGLCGRSHAAVGRATNNRRKAQGAQSMLTKRILLAGVAAVGLGLGASPGAGGRGGRGFALVDVRRRGRGRAAS